MRRGKNDPIVSPDSYTFNTFVTSAPKTRGNRLEKTLIFFALEGYSWTRATRTGTVANDQRRSTLHKQFNSQLS